jgi:outer membrane protein assembly factor BamA
MIPNLKIYFLILSNLISYLTIGQAQIRIFLNGELQNKQEINSELEINDLANKYWLELINEGFLYSNIDSTSQDSSVYSTFVSSGKKIKLKNYTISYDSNQRLKFGDFKLNKFNKDKLKNTINEILTYLNTNGYPFARVDLKNSLIDSSSISIKFKINEGPYIRIDSVYCPGLNNKEKTLIRKLVGLEHGDPFNSVKIKEISKNINSVNYIKQIKPSEYEFINGKVNLYTYNKVKNTNLINGIIGIQPGNDGQIKLTGNAKIDLYNSINKGEDFHLNWRRMFNASQFLSSSIQFPFLFGTNLSFNGLLEMFKKDTSFFNLESKIGLDYLINPVEKIGVFGSSISSINLNENSNYSSTKINDFGISLDFLNTNSLFNPTSGYQLKIEGKVGFKKTIYNSSSNSSTEITPNYNFKGNISKYIPIGKRKTIKLSNQFGSILNDNLFENELYRIGGYKTIRGFDEESLWVSSFSISTIEVRYLLEEKSNVFIFGDAAWSEKKITNHYENNWHFGVGSGISFQTQNGLLTLIYSLGKTQTQPFLFRTGKIHIGFTSFF